MKGMLELQCWVALVFDKRTNELKYTSTGKSRKSVEEWWNIHSKTVDKAITDVRYTLAQYREILE
jgi:hypothetical protein